MINKSASFRSLLYEVLIAGTFTICTNLLPPALFAYTYVNTHIHTYIELLPISQRPQKFSLFSQSSHDHYMRWYRGRGIDGDCGRAAYKYQMLDVLGQLVLNCDLKRQHRRIKQHITTFVSATSAPFFTINCSKRSQRHLIIECVPIFVKTRQLTIITSEWQAVYVVYP